MKTSSGIEIDPNKQLDLVIECLLLPEYPCYSSAYININLYRNKGIKADTREIDFILYELVKDEYIASDKELTKGIAFNGIQLSDLDEPFYFVTFSGKVFHQNGGYTRKKITEDAAVELANVLSSKMRRDSRITAIGSIIAAIFGGILLLWEICKGVYVNLDKIKEVLSCAC
jgi:hypothetical protein